MVKGWEKQVIVSDSKDFSALKGAKNRQRDSGRIVVHVKRVRADEYHSKNNRGRRLYDVKGVWMVYAKRVVLRRLEKVENRTKGGRRMETAFFSRLVLRYMTNHT